MTQRHDQIKNSSETVSVSAARTTTSRVFEMPKALTLQSKKIPDKCVRCALLSMAEVRSLHGAAGDGCYVTKVCRSRRSYARHRNLRNQTRRQRRHETSSETNGAKAETQPTAQLIVYRATRYNAPIDGIAAEVRQGKTKLATVQPVYCLGLLPKQIEAYIEAMRLVLQQDYGIDKFAGVVQQLPRSWQELKAAKQRSPRHREIKIDLPGVTDSHSAVLEIYRQPETTAVIALKTAVWRGATPESGTPLLDCRGLLPSQIHAYLGQVLALLQSRYSIRWFARKVQRSLESCLSWLGQTEQTSEGESEPEVTLDLDPLWWELETSLQQRDLLPVQALEVAAEGISQIVLQFAQFAELAFEELEAVAERGVILAEDVFNQYVRQTIEVDLEQFIEPLATLPRKHSERQKIREGNSVVGELNQAAVLQVLDEQMSQEPELTESEIFNGALALAHEEDVSAWGGMIAQWMQEHQSSLPLLELVQAMQMPLLNTWLGVLLSDEFVVEQRGQFYDLTSVWITVITHSDQFTESKSMPTRP